MKGVSLRNSPFFLKPILTQKVYEKKPQLNKQVVLTCLIFSFADAAWKAWSCSDCKCQIVGDKKEPLVETRFRFLSCILGRGT